MRLLFAFLAILMVLAACAPTEKSGEPYKFGGVFQLTGPQASYGNMVKYGMELAIEDINKQGGINGRPVIAVYEDSASDRTKATTAAQKLIQVDNVDALFSITPLVAGVVAPIAEENKVPYIYIGSANTFAVNKTYVFKDYPNPQDICEVLTRKAKELGHEKIALFGPDDEVTHLCREGAERVTKLTSFEKYAHGDTDFRAQFTKIKEAKPSALIFYSYTADCPNGYKQIKELGLKVQLFVPVQSFACGNTENTAANSELLENAYGSDIAFDEESTDPALVSFKNRLEERGWVINLRGSALEYDIVKEMANAYENCQDKECAITNLRNLQMNGITGKISYNGQIVNREVMLLKFEDGKWRKAE